MIVTPEEIKAAVQASKDKAEASKQAVQPPPDNPSTVDLQWESVRRARQK